MNQSTVDAVSIIVAALDRIDSDPTSRPSDAVYAYHALWRAIQHLARPDRALYPKRRGQRKTSRRVAC